MPDPYAPRRRRIGEGGRPEPIDAAGRLGSPELPVARLRRLGASEEAVGYYGRVWDLLDDNARVEWADDLAVVTDAELREDLATFDPDRAAPPERVARAASAPAGDTTSAPAGRVEHEGGGWYSLWVDGRQVDRENIKGREAANVELAKLLG